MADDEPMEELQTRRRPRPSYVDTVVIDEGSDEDPADADLDPGQLRRRYAASVQRLMNDLHLFFLPLLFPLLPPFSLFLPCTDLVPRRSDRALDKERKRQEKEAREDESYKGGSGLAKTKRRKKNPKKTVKAKTKPGRSRLFNSSSEANVALCPEPEKEKKADLILTLPLDILASVSLSASPVSLSEAHVGIIGILAITASGPAEPAARQEEHQCMAHER